MFYIFIHKKSKIIIRKVLFKVKFMYFCLTYIQPILLSIVPSRILKNMNKKNLSLYLY